MRIKINNIEFNVKLAITEKERRTGMMHKRFNEYNGMLFFESPGLSCFWMKNCIINLDIIFIEDNVITKIHHNCPPCQSDDCPNYCGEGNMVLEIEGGKCKKLGIKEGDSLSFSF